MKKIINGKKYDTETAKSCGYIESGRYGDFEWQHEELFLKRSGEFFIYGTGGATTKYAVPCSNGNWTGSSVISPIDFETAKKFSKENLSTDEYETIFGEVSEDSEKQTSSISISKQIFEYGKREAVKSNITFSAWIESLIKNELSKNNK